MVKHIFKHIESSQMCPVPSCGMDIYSDEEMLLHLICVHCIPMCGVESTKKVRRFCLPSANLSSGNSAAESSSSSLKRSEKLIF
jgi:hypothetical protein